MCGVVDPHLGYLGFADYMMVTPDSVSMRSEATAPGKPVYFFRLPEISQRHRPFLAKLVRLEVARPFDGELETWKYRPLDDVERATAAVGRSLTRAE